MEYLPLIWYYIPERVVTIMICMNKWFLVFKSWRIKTNTVLLLPPWLGKTIRNVCLTHDIWYVTFVVINIPSLPHSCFQRIFITSNTVGAINGTGIAYPSRSSEFVQVLVDSCCSIFFFIIISILHLWTIYLWVPGNLKGLPIFTMNNIIK
jgi:hypothetical protein